MSSLGFTKQPGDPLREVADAMNSDAAILFKLRQSRVPDRGNRHRVPTSNQFRSKIFDELLFTTNNRRVKLTHHQKAQNNP